MTDKPQPSSLDASRSLSPTCPNCGGSDPHALLIHPGGKCLHIWHQLCPQKPVSPVPVSPSGQRCGVLCGKCGTAAEMHVCPNGAYHFLRNEFTETWPPVKPNQGNKSPGTDRPADPSPVSSGLRVERERTCKRCGLELAWQSGYEQWTHKRSGLPFCNLSADPSLQVSPELISHDGARAAARALIGHFFKDDNRPKVQVRIPADDTDTDLILTRYINQQEARESRVTAPVGQLDELCANCLEPKAKHRPSVQSQANKPLGIEPARWLCTKVSSSSSITTFEPLASPQTQPNTFTTSPCGELSQYRVSSSTPEQPDERNFRRVEDFGERAHVPADHVMTAAQPLQVSAEQLARQIFFHVLLNGGEDNPFKSIRNEWFTELAAPKIVEVLGEAALAATPQLPDAVNDEPSEPMSPEAVKVLNSIVESRVPEENFIRDESEAAPPLVEPQE